MTTATLLARCGPAAAIALLVAGIVAFGAEPAPKNEPGGPPPEGTTGTGPAAGAAPAGAPSSPAAGSGGWFGSERPLIVPQFVDQFPGIDLKALTPPERERFLQRANTEPCTCGQTGCDRHMLAFCLKVDPGCPRVRGSLRKIVSDILAARPKPAPASPSPASPPAPAR